MTEESYGPECPPYLRKRTEIEEEIRNRQARWRAKHLAEEVRSGKRTRQEKPVRERQSSIEAVVDPEQDERPPPTSYKTRT